VLVEIVVQFVGVVAGVPRQRVHDDSFWQAIAGVDGLVEAEAAAVEVSFQFAVEALLLDAGQVHRVIADETLLHVFRFNNCVPVATQVFDNLRRHAQLDGGNKRERDAGIELDQLRQGMHRAAMFEVADHGDVHAFDGLRVTAQFLADGVQIQQRLAGMFIGAVSGIDHGNTAGTGEFGNRVGLGVAHHDDVVVAADDPGRVIQ